MKTITLAFALIGASLAVTSAPAPAAEPAAISVSYADLDLATAKGRLVLDRRLLHAARTACGTPSPADLRGRIKLDECVAVTIAAAGPGRDSAIALAQNQASGALASR